MPVFAFCIEASITRYSLARSSCQSPNDARKAIVATISAAGIKNLKIIITEWAKD